MVRFDGKFTGITNQCTEINLGKLSLYTANYRLRITKRVLLFSPLAGEAEFETTQAGDLDMGEQGNDPCVDNQ